MNCTIAGVTGLIGSHALKLLVDDSRVHQVISIARKSVVPHPKLKQIIISFEALENETLPQVDVALCALGTTIKAAGSQEAFKKVDHDYILNFAHAAKRAGAKKFVLISALGADINSKVFYNQIKGETERDLQELGFRALVILQPSLLLGERRQSRPFERAAVALEPLYNPLFSLKSLRKYKPVRASQVAKVMVEQALNSDFTSQILPNSEILSS